MGVLQFTEILAKVAGFGAPNIKPNSTVAQGITAGEHGHETMACMIECVGRE